MANTLLKCIRGLMFLRVYKAVAPTAAAVAAVAGTSHFAMRFLVLVTVTDAAHLLSAI